MTTLNRNDVGKDSNGHIDEMASTALRLYKRAEALAADRRLCVAARALYALTTVAGTVSAPLMGQWTRAAYGNELMVHIKPDSFNLRRAAERLTTLHPDVVDALLLQTPDHTITLLNAGAMCVRSDDEAVNAIGRVLLALAEPPFLTGYFRKRIATQREKEARELVYDDSISSLYPDIFVLALSFGEDTLLATN